MERRNLKTFRVSQGLTQREMAERLGMTRANYNLVENGKQGTSRRFSAALQREFGIPDGEMWALLKTMDEARKGGRKDG